MGYIFPCTDRQSEHAYHDAGRRQRFRVNDRAAVQRKLPGHPGLAGIPGHRGSVTAASRIHQRSGFRTVLQEARRQGGLQPDGQR